MYRMARAAEDAAQLRQGLAVDTTIPQSGFPLAVAFEDQTQIIVQTQITPAAGNQ